MGFCGYGKMTAELKGGQVGMRAAAARVPPPSKQKSPGLTWILPDKPEHRETTF